MERLAGIWPALSALDADVAQQLEHDARYAGYVDRQKKAVAAMRRDDACFLSADLEYHRISGLSVELCEKLTAVRPQTMGQAARIEGMTPAALALLLALSRRQAERRHA